MKLALLALLQTIWTFCCSSINLNSALSSVCQKTYQQERVNLKTEKFSVYYTNSVILYSVISPALLASLLTS